MLCFADGNDFYLPLDILLLSPFFPEGSEDGAILCLNVSIVDDDGFEGNHSFVVVAVPPFFNEDQIRPLTTVTIVDNEGAMALNMYNLYCRVRIEIGSRCIYMTLFIKEILCFTTTIYILLHAWSIALINFAIIANQHNFFP